MLLGQQGCDGGGAAGSRGGDKGVLLGSRGGQERGAAGQQVGATEECCWRAGGGDRKMCCCAGCLTLALGRIVVVEGRIGVPSGAATKLALPQALLVDMPRGAPPEADGI